MRDDNYMSYVLIGPDRKSQVEARLLALRRLRTRTKPLDAPSRWQVLRRWLALIGGVLALVALIVLALAVVAGLIGWQ